jgi:uncharacterized protein
MRDFGDAFRLNDLKLIDVNVNLGQWPTRRVAGDDPQALAEKLREHGVVEAWVGSFDGVFHHDLKAANARLAALCGAATVLRLVPFGAVDPLADEWEAELLRCAEEHRMPGIRLHPNYHGYALDHPRVARLLAAATERGLIVTIVAELEDQRMMHPQWRVKPVDLSPLNGLVQQTPGLCLLLLNAVRNPAAAAALHPLLGAGDVYVDMAMLEGLGGVEKLLAAVPQERILFGSFAPSFYFESALLKLQESALPRFQLEAVAQSNSRRLLPLS